MPSSSKSPALSAAARTCSVSDAARPSEKNGRPVLVQIAPAPARPKRALPPEAAGAAGLAEAAGAAGTSSGERHTSKTAREPMCFSSHSTDSTPSAR